MIRRIASNQTLPWRHSGRRLAWALWQLLPAVGAAALALWPAPSAAETCNGFANYANEIVPSAFQVVSSSSAGNGMTELELSFDVANTGVGDFESASLSPSLDYLSAGFGAQEIAAPATVGRLGPLAPAAALTSTLRLQVPASNVTALLAELANGTVPFVVHAEELPVLRPGIQTIEWDAAEEARYVLAVETLAGSNPDPGVPPFPTGTEFEVTLVEEGDGGSSAFDAFSPGDSFFVSAREYSPEEIPEALHFVRVLGVAKTDEAGTGPEASDDRTTWTLRLAPSDQTSLHAIFESGSFCSGTLAHVDPPVQSTRLNEIDGVGQGSRIPDSADGTSPAERRDFNPQPIQFNTLGVELGVDLSGQITGHILRPSIEIRIRDGHVYAAVDIDTDMSVAAELRATFAATFGTDFTLGELCFPVAGAIPVGPLEIGLTLQLEHLIGIWGSLPLAASVGFEQRLQGGVTIGFDSRQPEGDRYFTSWRAGAHPIAFTPPQLVDEADVEVSIVPELRATLRLGASYPICNVGAGAFLSHRTTATLGVDGVADPWWEYVVETELVAGIELDVLGLGIASFEAEGLPLFGGQTDAGGPLVLPGAQSASTLRAGAPEETFLSGEDQRWAIAIDEVGNNEDIEHSSSDPLEDGSFVVIGSPRGIGPSPIVKLDRHGALEWSHTYHREPDTVLAMPDGTILVAGTRAWLARHEADGTLLWSREFELNDDGGASSFCRIRDAAPIEEAPGQWGAVVVGVIGRALITQNDGCAFRVDANGALLWSKTYSGGNIREFRGVTTTSDGDVAAVGYGQTGPLMALLDGADGHVKWDFIAPLRGSRRGELNTVAEGDDGLLYAGGTTGRDIRGTGAALVLRANKDGSDVRHALLFQDLYWEEPTLLNPNSGYFPTEGGDTPGDAILDIAPVPGGLVLVGSSGAGSDAAAWVARLNENLGVQWFRVFDGERGEVLDSIAPLSDGLLVSGFSDSLPQEDGQIDSHVWVMKLSGSGGADLLDGRGLVTRFMAPGVRASSLDERVVAEFLAVSTPAGLIEADAPEQTPFPDDVERLISSDLTHCVSKLSGSGRVGNNACVLDADADGIADPDDNCRLVPNPDQRDSNADGYGNLCDADLDDDGIVGPSDFFTGFRPCVGADLLLAPECDVADLDGDGIVASGDFFSVFRSSMGGPPGPSGLLGE